MVVTVGKREANINGETRPMETPPELKNGKAYIHIRPLAEFADYDIYWDNNTYTVKLAKRDEQQNEGIP